MDSLDYWRLCDEVSVIQAALLIIDENPSKFDDSIERWDVWERPDGYEAAKTALINAVRSEKLAARVRHETHPRGYNEEAVNGQSIYAINGMHYIFNPEPDWYQTTIQVDDLKAWLTSRGFRAGFFFAQTEKTPDYLHTSSSYYSGKLAATIQAWSAVSANAELLKGKTAKQALAKWLRMNAGVYGLIKDDGSPNENGIEEIAKIANWDTKGGAPKTPEPETPPNKTPNCSQNNSLKDIDIPF